MTLSQRLRKEVCKKLNVKERQLLNVIARVAADAGIADRDIALLLVAHQKHIDVAKPRYTVPKDKLERFEQLRTQGTVVLPIVPIPSQAGRRKQNGGQVKKRRFLNFGGKYPDIFYDRLEYEINEAFSNPNLPNAVLVLARKLIENLVYNILQYKFDGPKIDLYYDTNHSRAHDFSILLDNLKNHKSEFDMDLQDDIDKFLESAHPFRRDVNSKAHRIMEYLESTRQLGKLKIPEMTQILLKLVGRVKKQTTAYVLGS
jgi:hypothetical protein